MTAEQSKELLLSVRGLKKNFGEREILKGIDFDVHKGDVVCVIGPSGSGKSTLIRCVNYLEQPSQDQEQKLVHPSTIFPAPKPKLWQ